MIKKYIPSVITVFRLISSIVLLFMAPFQTPFFILYSLCGISDVVDGCLARIWKVESDKGAALDSTADLLFYSVFMIRFIPVLRRELPIWGWCYLFLVLSIRALSYLTVALKFHRFAAVHTYGNKLTGIAVFGTPYLKFALSMPHIALLVGTIGFLAAIDEWLIHICSNEYRPEIKSFVRLLKAKKGATAPNSV